MPRCAVFRKTYRSHESYSRGSLSPHSKRSNIQHNYTFLEQSSRLHFIHSKPTGNSSSSRNRPVVICTGASVRISKCSADRSVLSNDIQRSRFVLIVPAELSLARLFLLTTSVTTFVLLFGSKWHFSQPRVNNSACVTRTAACRTVAG